LSNSAQRQFQIGPVPDILLSDLNMPRMSGFELLSVVRRRFPEVFVIASSAAFFRRGGPGWDCRGCFLWKIDGADTPLRACEDCYSQRPCSGWVDASTPIWISRTKDDTLSFERLPITCPECLRGFSLSVGASDSVLKELIACAVTPRFTTESLHVWSRQRRANRTDGGGYRVPYF